jgi:SM-20-related protein
MQRYETLINGLIDQGFGSCDAFLDHPTLQGLRSKLLRYHHEGAMHPAGVGRNFDYQKNAEIRGDVIRWIDHGTDDPCEKSFLSRVNEFIHHLNTTCFTGINGYEFHYAYYESGSFYKRHLDRFKNDRGRQFSFVLYLNEGWQEENNGRLSLYLENEEISIYPMEGKVVFFRSDQTEHEVHPSLGRPRLSIAGWLKRQ